VICFLTFLEPLLLEIEISDLSFHNKIPKPIHMAGRPISITQAHEMTRLYVDHVRNLPVHPVKKTQYVSFTLSDLMNYLRQAEKNADEIRIYLGVHSESSQNPGRLTTILWPYKDGEPAAGAYVEGKDGGGGGEGFPPYDEGSGNP